MCTMYQHIWQSRIEIKNYSVACFIHISAFEALYRRTSVKSGADMHCINNKPMNTWHVFTVHITPTLNGSSALQHFECGNMIEICNRIMFNFYPGLPRVLDVASFPNTLNIGGSTRYTLLVHVWFPSFQCLPGMITCFCEEITETLCCVGKNWGWQLCLQIQKVLHRNTSLVCK